MKQIAQYQDGRLELQEVPRPTTTVTPDESGAAARGGMSRAGQRARSGISFPRDPDVVMRAAIIALWILAAPALAQADRPG